MKKILSFVYSKKIVAFVILFLQLFLVILGISFLNGKFGIHWRVAEIVLTLASYMIIVYETNRSSEPSFKMTWMLIILVFPAFGILLYILNRANFQTKILLRRYKDVRKRTGVNLIKSEDTYAEIEEKLPQYTGIINYLENCSGSPAYKNTSVDYFSLGEDFLEDIKSELSEAKRFIFMEYFIINAHTNDSQNSHIWGEILDILIQKVNEGVEVRLLYDGMGCLGTVPKGYDKTLNEMGINCKIFSPIVPFLSTHQNNRDHRKICIIDGKVAYTGGINIADEYANRKVRFGHWKDTGIKLRGEAVCGFCALFLEMWNLKKNNDTDEEIRKYIVASRSREEDAEGYIVPFGDTPIDDDSVGERVYIDILNNSKKFVYITTPYLVIDYEMYEAIKYATRRGVEVSVIMPHIPDKKYAFYLSRTYYPELLDAGVRIYEYKDGFVHAKMSIGDGKVALVGTVNHDFRSLYLHYECGALLLNVPQIEKIEKDFCDMMKKSLKVTKEFYKSLPWYQRIYGQVIKLFAPLL